MKTVKLYNELKKWAESQDLNTCNNATKHIIRIINSSIYQVEQRYCNRRWCVDVIYMALCDEPDYVDCSKQYLQDFRATAHQLKQVINAYKH